MKGILYDLDGKKKSEVEMPKIFDSEIREDIVAKYFEADKTLQPYGAYFRAGKRHSASGTISHKRHDWKGQYGRGISRTPRKAMWRRGTQFNWIGTEVSNTRGGRVAHPPKPIRAEKKINAKEAVIAMNSGFASTAHVKFVKMRYATISEVKVPVVIDSNVGKMKDFKKFLESVFNNDKIVFKNYQVRAGKGKVRGRKYKSNAGVLIITGNNENFKVNGLDVRKVKEVSISDLYPLGRLAVYTSKALEDLGGKK